MTRSQAIATLFLAGAVALSIGSVLATSNRLENIPTDAALERAAAQVRKDFRAGDAVRVVPPWNEGLWLRLQDIGEGTERFPFPALLRGDRVDPMTLYSFKRLWLIGTFGMPPALSADIAEGGRELSRRDLGGGVSVALFALPKVAHKGRLTRDLRRLKVTRRSKTREKNCPLTGKRYRCGKPGWGNPHVETRDVFHNEVSWLLAHAPPGRETLTVTWRAPRGKTLIVRAGFSLQGVRKEPGSPTKLRVLVDDVVKADITVPPHRYLLFRRAVALDAKRRHAIRFEVSANDHRYRQLMLEADVIDEVPPGLQRWIDASP